ncbi:MAG TPA: hypothetical protein VN380_00535 [Thermoanaerobaculia bacterium]|jgi:hypothetical protein|nr:hypothetical protein [Thermoanaerobaculia bacterium]
MTKQTKQKALTEDEIDEIVIAQVDDDEAWEEEFSVTPVSLPHAAVENESTRHQGHRNSR